jgi:DNA-binding HxlR family transcriptional regulator
VENERKMSTKETMQTIKPKLRGSELKRLILCTCREPIKTKDILQILRLTNEVNERTVRSKLQELLFEGEINRITDLDHPNHFFYFLC